MNTCHSCKQEIKPTQVDKGLGECRCSTWFFYEEGGWYKIGRKNNLGTAARPLKWTNKGKAD